jgi:hypothetical protein
MKQKEEEERRKVLRKKVKRSSSESEIWQRIFTGTATTSRQSVSKVILISVFAHFGSDRQLSLAELDASSNAELPYRP